MLRPPDRKPDTSNKPLPSAAAIWPPLRPFIAGEYRLGRLMARRRWTSALYEFIRFGLKQGWACLFGGIAVFLMIATWWFYPATAWLPRYDFLFLCMITVQIALLAGGLETSDEAKVILIYHVVGTVMEIFKTKAGSWIYPEPNFFRLGGVPLFSGFMYACIGSYICRACRLFDFEFSHHPRRLGLAVLSVAIYVNFFSHHFMPDLRWLLFAVAGWLFLRTRVYFRVWHVSRSMPLLLGLALVSLFIWFLGKHRHVHQNLALSVAAARLVDGLLRQVRLMVPAADHQLHAGEPGPCAARQARGPVYDRRAEKIQSHAGFLASPTVRNVIVAGPISTEPDGDVTAANRGSSSFGSRSKAVPFSFTPALCRSSADSV
jgi:uncharacterized membrane protein YoaT (DUF817 family)